MPPRTRAAERRRRIRPHRPAATLNFHCASVSLLARFRLNQVCDEWKQNIKVVLFGEDQIQRKVR